MNPHRRRLKLYLLFGWNFIVATTLFPLDPHKRITQYDLRVYTAKDGLPMNCTKKVFQDSRGYIWIGTQEGLVRFDGRDFKLYDKSRFAALRCNFIMDIAEDSSGNLWLATQGGGICRFDGQKFTTLDTRDGLVHNIVNKIMVGRDRTIWVGTANGLSHLKQGRFRNFTIADGLCGNNVQAILEDRHGNLFISVTGKDFNIIKNDSIITYMLEDFQITSLYERPSGEILLGSYANYIFGFKADKLYPFWPEHRLTRSMEYIVMRDIIEDGRGNLWFATEKKGIFRYFNGRVDTLTTTHGLPTLNDHFLSILEDNEGSLWFAGDAGLIQLKDNKFFNYGILEGSKSSHGHTVCEDQTGNICVGFRESGLTIFNRYTTQNYANPGGILPYSILSVFPADDGGLWLGYE